MCGFVGFVGGTDNQSEVLTKMMDRIVHRGPDMGGQFIDGRVALGFRRLSILDLTEAGAQPMANEDGSVVIVFNGEIYNFQELRSELEAKGYKFHCGADTESLLHGYEEWGEAVLDRLRGMYAFVIWDKKKNKLFGARDIFGIKPLYYYPMADAGDGAPGVLFGSEIKSFLDYPHFHKAVNKKALRPYMTLQYSATEETFFEGVYKLPPAHYFTVDIPTGKMNIERYWDCDYSAVEKPMADAGDGAPGVLFGSEIKSFLDYPHFHKAVNKKALRPYMTLQYSATEETFFEGVYKLPPAHYFTVDIPTGKMNIERYWDCDYSAVEKPFEEYVDELDEVVHESVEAHRIADVKVASFLSGGVDSSYIAACLMPDKTFSVGFDYKNFNETNYAKELSDKLGVENVRKMITADEFFGALEDIQYHMDEPQSNLSSVPLWFLAEMARKDVTVVLSGEGADELFGGYAYYEDTVPVRKYKKMVPLPIRRALGNLALHMPYFKGHNFLVKGAEIPEKSFLGQALVWPEREVDDVLKPEYNTGDGAFELAAPIYARVKGQPELVKKQYLDMNMWLPGDILLKADKMCMAHSLELRVPFLDRKVMEFAEHIPDRYRINENGNKQVLRHAANKSLPDEWATRPKVGFPVPIVYWLREQKWYDYVKEYFTAPWASEFFDTDELMHLLDLHFAGKGDFQRKIYTPLVFLVWYKRFFIDEDQPAVQAA